MEKGNAWQLVASYFEQWYARFVRYAYGMTGDLAVSEDMVQEVYLRLYLQMRQNKVIERPEGWIFCVLRRGIQKHRHSRVKYEAQHESIEGIQIKEPERLFTSGFHEVDLDGIDLGEFLQVLTPREREVILLRLTPLKYREIAEVLAISANSVNTLLARAIRKLQKAAKKNLRSSGHVVSRHP